MTPPSRPSPCRHRSTSTSKTWDASYERAVRAGGKSLREPADQFYGDRSAGVEDAAGNQWWLATHVEDVSPEEMQRRQEAMATQSAG